MSIRIMKEDITNSRFNSKLISLLDSQGYTIDDVIAHISSKITNDSDKYFNISVATDVTSDYYDSQCEDDLEEAIIEVLQDMEDEILSDKSVDEVDILEFIVDGFNYDSDAIHDVDNDYESNGEAMRDEWQDESDYLERDYWNSRI